jgi:hypothetical protein
MDTVLDIETNQEEYTILIGSVHKMVMGPSI